MTGADMIVSVCTVVSYVSHRGAQLRWKVSIVQRVRPRHRLGRDTATMVMVGVVYVGVAMLHVVGIWVVSFVGQVPVRYWVYLEVFGGPEMRV